MYVFYFMIHSARFELYNRNITKLKTMTFETRLIHLQYKYYYFIMSCIRKNKIYFNKHTLNFPKSL